MSDRTDMRRSDTGLVQKVGGRPCIFHTPVRAFWAVALLAVVATTLTGDWIHLGGIAMALVGISGANPRFSPVNGCLAWTLIVAAGTFAIFNPAMGIPLAAWGALAWLGGSLETRLTMKPLRNNGEDAETAPAPHEAGSGRSRSDSA